MGKKKIKLGAVSAYAIAKKYGYTGTEQEWNDEQMRLRNEAASSAKEAKDAVAGAKAAIEKTGAEVKASITEDYTALSNQVSSLSSEIATGYINKKAEINWEIGGIEDDGSISSSSVYVHSQLISLSDWMGGTVTTGGKKVDVFLYNNDGTFKRRTNGLDLNMTCVVDSTWDSWTQGLARLRTTSGYESDLIVVEGPKKILVKPEDLKPIETRLDNLEDNKGTLDDIYISEVERVKSEISKLPYGLTFTFATDIHLQSQTDIYKMKILGECGKFSDFTVLNGDIIDGSKTLRKNDVKQILSDGVNAIRNYTSEVYSVYGNHEDNFYGVNVFGDEEILTNLDFLDAVKKGNDDAIIDYENAEQSWYYVDFPQHKVRAIFFNFCSAFDANGTLKEMSTATSNFRIPNEEILWMRDKALRFDEKRDWAVIVFSHLNPVRDSNVGYMALYNTNMFSYMLEAFKNGSKWTSIDPGAGYGDNNVFDFTEQGAMELIGVFSGHQHVDVISKENQWGILCVNTCCDLNRLESGVEVQTSETPITTKSAPKRTNGTITTECFDVVKIDRKNRTVNIIRYGAGNSRTVTY